MNLFFLYFCEPTTFSRNLIRKNNPNINCLSGFPGAKGISSKLTLWPLYRRVMFQQQFFILRPSGGNTLFEFWFYNSLKSLCWKIKQKKNVHDSWFHWSIISYCKSYTRFLCAVFNKQFNMCVYRFNRVSLPLACILKEKGKQKEIQ